MATQQGTSTVIAPDLSVPEALVVLAGPRISRRAVSAATLMELELRGAIRCSPPHGTGIKALLQTGRFKIEVLDGPPTGDEVLDSAMTVVSAMAAAHGGRVNFAPAGPIVRKLDVRAHYLDRLVDAGWLGRPRRRVVPLGHRYAVENQESLQAMQKRLAAYLLGGQVLEPRDEALLAVIAAYQGDPQRVWCCLPVAEREGADRSKLKRKKELVLRRATQAMNGQPVAHALYQTIRAESSGG